MRWKNLLLKRLHGSITKKKCIEEDASNDLKEFGVDSDAPDLFSTENRKLKC